MAARCRRSAVVVSIALVVLVGALLVSHRPAAAVLVAIRKDGDTVLPRAQDAKRPTAAVLPPILSQQPLTPPQQQPQQQQQAALEEEDRNPATNTHRAEAYINFNAATRRVQRPWHEFKRVWLHVGSHADPLISVDPDTVTIAVEPDAFVAASIPPHPQLHVLIAAVGNVSAVAPFHVYNKGLSSSLGTATPRMVDVFTNEGGGRAVPDASFLVPVLPLADLLRYVEHTVRLPVQLMLTDMQGMDFSAVTSAAAAVPALFSAIQNLITEASCGRLSPSYTGLHNHVDYDWIPFMRAHGGYYIKPHRAVGSSGHPQLMCTYIGESDLYWQAVTAPVGLADLRRVSRNGTVEPIVFGDGPLLNMATTIFPDAGPRP